MPKPNRTRCAELIIEYGQANPPFLQGIIESYVANLVNKDVDRFLELLKPEGKHESTLWKGKKASLGEEGEGFKGGTNGQEA